MEERFWYLTYLTDSLSNHLYWKPNLLPKTGTIGRVGPGEEEVSDTGESDKAEERVGTRS